MCLQLALSKPSASTWTPLELNTDWFIGAAQKLAEEEEEKEEDEENLRARWLNVSYGEWGRKWRGVKGSEGYTLDSAVDIINKHKFPFKQWLNNRF